MADLQRAAELFPYNRHLAVAPAYFAIRWLPPSEETVDVIGAALRRDPFSADLTNGLALHAYGIRNDFLANAAWRAFTRIAPNSPKAAQVGRALEALP